MSSRCGEQPSEQVHPYAASLPCSGTEAEATHDRTDDEFCWWHPWDEPLARASKRSCTAPASKFAKTRAGAILELLWFIFCRRHAHIASVSDDVYHSE